MDLFTLAVSLVNPFLNIGINQNVLTSLVLLFPILCLLLHSFWSLTIPRGIIFISLAVLIGFFDEAWGLYAGTAFGGHYVYKQSAFMLLNVPYIVPIYWAVFIYTAYCVTNSFLFWNNKNKPGKLHHNFFLIPLLLAFDGIFAVIIDLIMDPIQVHLGTWTWLEKGPYFGIPIGNFIGWFIVTVLVVGIYRTYEYFYPKAINISKTTFMIPVIGYGALSIAMLFLALQNNLYPIAVLSLLIMFPIPIINGIYFAYNRSFKTV
jgi:putative membrane protein